MSVGHPHAGYLFNAVRMPSGDTWIVVDPAHAWGTEETVQALVHCFRRMRELHPDAPRAILGGISPKHGGHFPPHKSHRTGRDADVYLYRTDRQRLNKPATADDLDRKHTWALIRLLVTEVDVEFILVDRAVIQLLQDYALEIGEDPGWVAELFRGKGPYPYPLIKHAPGHVAHLHIRFVSPEARERGRLAYDALLAQGHLRAATRQVEHVVVEGDSLTKLAAKHGTTVDRIRADNTLASSKITPGQRLTIQEQVDIRGAREHVAVPKRLVPPRHPRPDVAVAAREGERDAPVAENEPPPPNQASGSSAEHSVEKASDAKPLARVKAAPLHALPRGVVRR